MVDEYLAVVPKEDRVTEEHTVTLRFVRKGVLKCMVSSSRPG